ncbi:MAG TPA: class I SAM-dependent methyltransferase [Solirubrobacteraceae bacterium]|nr:class I SAM-dependent methyltransferase [Solirubrobacteraceae bacterium]
MRPQRTHLEVLRSELKLSGAMVIDVGCGTGALTHRLAEEGARVVGVDPSADAIARASGRGEPSERYLVGRAEDLPVEDRSADIVTFLNSLHHVSIAALVQALAEARRVLRADGIVYVQEPLAEGEYFEVVRLLDDEREVRAAAQDALRGARGVGLEVIRELEYDALVRHRDFGAFRDRMLMAGCQRASAFAARASQVEEHFHRAARQDPDGWSFLQPTRVTLLGGIASNESETINTKESHERRAV